MALNPHVSKMLALMSGVLGTIALARPASTDDDAVELTRDGMAATKIKLEAGASATSGLEAVMQALGVEDVAGATKKIAEMFKSCEMLEKAMPELKALRDSQADGEEKDADGDVDKTMQAHRMGANMKPALMFMRTGGHPKTELAKRHAARAEFFKAYPPTDSRALALTRPTGLDSPGTIPVAPPAGTQVTTGIDGQTLVDLTRFPGNVTEQALAFLEERGDFKVKNGGRSLSRPEKFAAAAKLLRSANVVGLNR